MIRGIGPVYAKKMVRVFGDKVFDIIEAKPERLREVDGIGPVRAKRITDAWAEQKIVREIMVFLHSNGVGTARAVRIYKTYGADAIQVMTENPYRLARDIRGIGFKTADAIAMKLGIEKTAMMRIRAGISYALTEAMDEGHCGLPTEELVPLAAELLEVPKELIQTALELELAEGSVIADRVGETPCIFLAGLYRAEQVIAERLKQLASRQAPLALHRSGQGPAMDRAEDRPHARRKPGRRHSPGPDGKGPGHHRRSRRRQDHHRQFHPAHSRSQGRQPPALRPHRACRKAHDRGDRLRGQDHPPASRGRPQGGWLQAERGTPPRLRPARHRRDLDGRCHADAGAAQGHT